MDTIPAVADIPLPGEVLPLEIERDDKLAVELNINPLTENTDELPNQISESSENIENDLDNKKTENENLDIVQIAEVDHSVCMETDEPTNAQENVECVTKETELPDLNNEEDDTSTMTNIVELVMTSESECITGENESSDVIQETVETEEKQTEPTNTESTDLNTQNTEITALNTQNTKPIDIKHIEAKQNVEENEAQLIITETNETDSATIDDNVNITQEINFSVENSEFNDIELKLASMEKDIDSEELNTSNSNPEMIPVIKITEITNSEETTLYLNALEDVSFNSETTEKAEEEMQTEECEVTTKDESQVVTTETTENKAETIVETVESKPEEITQESPPQENLESETEKSESIQIPEECKDETTNNDTNSSSGDVSETGETIIIERIEELTEEQVKVDSTSEISNKVPEILILETDTEQVTIELGNADTSVSDQITFEIIEELTVDSKTTEENTAETTNAGIVEEPDDSGVAENTEIYTEFEITQDEIKESQGIDETGTEEPEPELNIKIVESKTTTEVERIEMEVIENTTTEELENESDAIPTEELVNEHTAVATETEELVNEQHTFDATTTEELVNEDKTVATTKEKLINEQHTIDATTTEELVNEEHTINATTTEELINEHTTDGATTEDLVNEQHTIDVTTSEELVDEQQITEVRTTEELVNDQQNTVEESAIVAQVSSAELEEQICKSEEMLKPIIIVEGEILPDTQTAEEETKTTEVSLKTESTELKLDECEEMETVYIIQEVTEDQETTLEVAVKEPMSPKPTLRTPDAPKESPKKESTPKLTPKKKPTRASTRNRQEFTVPCHVLGRNIDNPTEDLISNGRTPPKPRLGVKVPYRFLTSQIVSKQDIADEVLERVAKRNPDPDPPTGVDIFFANKLTQRLARKIVAKTNKSEETSPKPCTVQIRPAPPSTEQAPNKTSETPAASSSQNAIGDNSDLLALLEGEVDVDWTKEVQSARVDPSRKLSDSDILIQENIVSPTPATATSPGGSKRTMDPETERQLALKQLQQFPKKEGRGRGRKPLHYYRDITRRVSARQQYARRFKLELVEQPEPQVHQQQQPGPSSVTRQVPESPKEVSKDVKQAAEMVMEKLKEKKIEQVVQQANLDVKKEPVNDTSDYLIGPILTGRKVTKTYSRKEAVLNIPADLEYIVNETESNIPESVVENEQQKTGDAAPAELEKTGRGEIQIIVDEQSKNMTLQFLNEKRKSGDVNLDQKKDEKNQQLAEQEVVEKTDKPNEPENKTKAQTNETVENVAPNVDKQETAAKNNPKETSNNNEQNQNASKKKLMDSNANKRNIRKNQASPPRMRRAKRSLSDISKPQIPLVSKRNRVIKRKVIWDPAEVPVLRSPPQVKKYKSLEIMEKPAKPKTSPKKSLVIEKPVEQKSTEKSAQVQQKPASEVSPKADKDKVQREDKVQKEEKMQKEEKVHKEEKVRKEDKVQKEHKPQKEAKMTKVLRPRTRSHIIPKMLKKIQKGKKIILARNLKTIAGHLIRSSNGELKKAITLSKKKKTISTIEKKLKPKRTELDKLLMDEGAVNLLYSVKDESPVKKKSIISLDRAQRDLLNRTKAVKDVITQSSSSLEEFSISLRKKESPTSITLFQSPPRKKSRDSIRSSIQSPPPSPSYMYPQRAEASRIIRRHSSSFSSECSSPRRLSVDNQQQTAEPKQDVQQAEKQTDTPNDKESVEPQTPVRVLRKKGVPIFKRKSEEKTYRGKKRDADSIDAKDVENKDATKESSDRLSQSKSSESPKTESAKLTSAEKRKLNTEMSKNFSKQTPKKRTRRSKNLEEEFANDESEKVVEKVAVKEAKKPEAVVVKDEMKEKQKDKIGSRHVTLNTSYNEISLRKVDSLVQIILTSTSTKLKSVLNLQMFSELCEVLSNLAKDDSCRVVLMTSTDSAFCHGVDFSTLIQTTAEKRLAVAEEMAKTLKLFLESLASFPKPLVVGIQGSAVGLGVTMLPLFDLVLASDRATFSTPYGRLGQIPEGVAFLTLPTLLGSALTSEMLFANRKLTASEALHHGLVTRVLWPDKFQEELVSHAMTIAQQSPQCVVATKSLLRQPLLSKLKEALETESKLLVQHWVSAECQQNFKKMLHEEEWW